MPKPQRLSLDSATALKGPKLSVGASTAFSNREWARTWKAAARELEAVRRAEIRSADTAAAIFALDDAVRSMVSSLSPRSSSGFVEIQTIFQQGSKFGVRREAKRDASLTGSDHRVVSLTRRTVNGATANGEGRTSCVWRQIRLNAAL